YRAVLDYILGVRPSWDGMKIDPALPPHWEEAEVIRNHRGVEWKVKINQKPDSKGEIEKIVVDNNEVESNIIPYPKDKKKIKVEVFVK
ncbi:MAG: glycosyl transferase, partial [bacterium]